MGLYHSTYLGAGIKFKTLKENSIVTIKYCGCQEHYHSDKFCKDCGKPIVEKQIEKEFFVDIDEKLGEDIFIVFHQDDGTTLLMSNYSDHLIDTEELNKGILLDSNIIQTYINNFKVKHLKEIQILSELGVDVKVEFFFYHDYS